MLLDDKVEFKKISNIDDKERALVEAFSSGKDHIDSYLKNEALEDLQYGITKTYLTELGRSRPSSIGGWWMPFGMRVTVGNSKTDN